MKYTGSAELRKLIYKGNFGLDEDEFLETISCLDHLRKVMEEIGVLAHEAGEDDLADSIGNKADYIRETLNTAISYLDDISVRDLTDDLADLKRIHTIEKEG